MRKTWPLSRTLCRATTEIQLAIHTSRGTPLDGEAVEGRTRLNQAIRGCFRLESLPNCSSSVWTGPHTHMSSLRGWGCFLLVPLWCCLPQQNPVQPTPTPSRAVLFHNPLPVPLLPRVCPCSTGSKAPQPRPRGAAVERCGEIVTTKGRLQNHGAAQRAMNQLHICQ